MSVRRRPHLAAFLERVAALFEVVVFTASQKVRCPLLLASQMPATAACLPRCQKHTQRSKL